MIQATLHQLAVFEATARHGSFTRAAEELYITQPTVSSQIKQLSKALGLPLFEQLGKRLYLTEAGKELLAACQEVFGQLDRLEIKLADLKGTKQGKLQLSAITTTKYFIPRLLGAFCQKYPGIDVALKVANHQQIRERMQQNQDDLYICSQLPGEMDLQAAPFLDNPLVVVAPRQHPLAGKGWIPLGKLNGETFIMREPGSGTRDAVEKLFGEHHIQVKVRLELGSNEAIKQAIAGGLGISVLSQHALHSQGLAEELAILNVEHFPLLRRWYVAYLGGKQLSAIAQAFLEFLLKQSEQITLPCLSRQATA
ncbi:MAG: LysR family transcriptional regulator [Chloroflexaceae bacterium]|nr:LysR family transcriptional regulator [Chloroflexaceae bacterium]